MCGWAEKYPNFHLIFDEMYLNSTQEGVFVKSSVEYSNKLSNVHTVRGFAKDYGLCGFHVGFLVTSNQEFKDKLVKLEIINTPHPYVLTSIARML